MKRKRVILFAVLCMTVLFLSSLMQFRVKAEIDNGNAYSDMESCEHDYETTSIAHGTAVLVCSKCGEATSGRVPTDFFAYWKRTDNDGHFASSIPTRLGKGDAVAYMLQPFYSTDSGTTMGDMIVESDDPANCIIDTNSETIRFLQFGEYRITIYPKYNPDLKKDYTFMVTGAVESVTLISDVSDSVPFGTEVNVQVNVIGGKGPLDYLLYRVMDDGRDDLLELNYTGGFSFKPVETGPYRVRGVVVDRGDVSNRVSSEILEFTVTEAELEGWQDFNGRMYYYENNAYVTGWKDIDGSRYYFSENGIMELGRFLDFGNGVYYFHPDGRMATGWTIFEENWFYFDPETGILIPGVTDVYQASDGKWYCRVSRSGVAASSWYTGFGRNEYGWWYLENGPVNFGKNGIIQGIANSDPQAIGVEGRWLVKGGKVVDETTVANAADGWWFINHGRVDTGYSGIQNNSYGWWRIENGKVNFNFKGFASNEYGWWYLNGGKVDFGKNDIIHGAGNTDPNAPGIDGWWLVREGKIVDETTVANNSNGWWFVRNGKVDFDYTGVQNNSNGWWKIEDGKVNFNFKGFASNEYGWWYLENGKVDFKKNDIINGIANTDPNAAGEEGWWLVRDSKVSNETTVAQNSYGWWKVEEGKVNFNFTGLADNEYGTWYLKDGKVDFSFTGSVYGRTIINGKAQ